MSAPLRSSGAAVPLPAAAAMTGALRREVVRGLTAAPKTLSSKLFYDAEGARLFERICELDEYYLTRTEIEILKAHLPEIAELAGPHATLIEYGSGAGVKVRLLLDTLDLPSVYTPVDISGAQLLRVSEEISKRYPALVVLPVCADYTLPFNIPRATEGRRVAFFPGSTIGNFHPPEAAAFLRRIRRAVGNSGKLILGVDRRKDTETLNAAYNDSRGVTAAFNLNVLTRLNREVDADFDPSRFRHRAWFNEAASRIEMHVECIQPAVIHIDGHDIPFQRGETIWTESSYKYDRDGLDALVSAAGFRAERLWTDRNGWFWVAVLAVGDDNQMGEP